MEPLAGTRPAAPHPARAGAIDAVRAWALKNDRRALLLAALVVVDALLLLGLRLLGVGGPIELIAQVAFVAAMVALAVVDLRVAVALAVFELAVAGASGRWTVFPGGVSGRLVLDGIVFAVALVRLAAIARRTRTLPFGRYGLHALVVALLLPGIWIPLGIVNGWRPTDAWSDGNGYAFLAFALVIAALAATSSVAWLRRWLLVACVGAAIITVALLMLVAIGVPPYVIRRAAIGTLDMGGHVGNYGGDVRIYLGSGLYLVVGVALLAWELLRRPRSVTLWVAAAVFAVALLASDTRGYWLAAGLAVVLVFALAMPSLRRLLAATGATLGLAVLITVGGLLVGFNAPQYVADRLISAFVLIAPDEDTSPVEMPRGVGSNATKIHQVQILLGHVAERPLQGWGFGAIAPDYPYSNHYSYEVTYVALAYKAGLVGLLLFLTFPLRLLVDAVRMRLGRLPTPSGLSARHAAVPVAVIAALLVLGATNPYLVAAFGLAPLVLMLAWLDPFERAVSR